MLVLTLIASAFAQDTFDAHGFALAPLDGDLRDGLEVGRAGRFTKGQYWASGVGEFAKAPLVYVLPNGTVERRLDNVFGVNTSFGYAVDDLVRLDLQLPLYLTSTGQDGGNGVGLGDARIGGMIAAVQPDDDDLGLGVAVSPWLVLPTGQRSAYLGDGKVGGGGAVSFSYAQDAVTVSGDVGVELRPSVQVGNLNGSDRILYGAAVSYLIDDETAVALEARLHSPTKPTSFPNAGGTNFPAEVHAVGKKRLETGAFFLLGASAPVTRGAGAAQYRIFFGGGFGTPLDIDRDTDLDGFLDSVDACITDPETVNQYNDGDGCPDKLGRIELAVNFDGKPYTGANVIVFPPEGALIPTDPAWDAMPGTAWSAKATAGACLAGEASTTAVEGAPSPLAIELEPVLGTTITVEVADNKGRPVPESMASWETTNDPCVPNGSLATDSGKATTEVGAGPHRSIVTAPGYKSVITDIVVEPGVPQTVKVVLVPTKVKVTAEKIVILDKVFFETGKDIIKPISYGLLDDVAGTLITNPQLSKVEVGGHTDADGTDAANLDLSQRRAEAVRKYLIGKGVEEGRLTAMGYGEGKPIDTNRTTTGKANNRRVEFVILETAPQE